jgi:hypothetical protein
MTADARRAPMSDEHKAALAQGRAQGRSVRAYLEALEANRPKRGRKRTTESVEERLAKVDAELDRAGSIKRLQLIQERMDLLSELGSGGDEVVDIEKLEREFVDVAAAYGERKGITYAAWREFGIDAAVLTRAGVGRSHRRS